MRRGILRPVALLGALMLVTFTAGAASASATFWASGAFTIADVDEDEVITGGWPSFSDARRCLYQDTCPDLESIAYADVDISHEMQRYDDYAYFTVTNGLVSKTTLWFVCSYDGEGQILDCWRDRDPSWGLMGMLGPDARELRLLPVQSAPNEYHVHLYVT